MTTEQIESRKAQLEATISKLAGCPTEITIRGLREFTLSAEGDQTAKLTRAVEAIGGKLEDLAAQGYDPEIDYTAVFFTA